MKNVKLATELVYTLAWLNVTVQWSYAVNAKERDALNSFIDTRNSLRGELGMASSKEYFAAILESSSVKEKIYS